VGFYPESNSDIQKCKK